LTEATAGASHYGNLALQPARHYRHPSRCLAIEPLRENSARLPVKGDSCSGTLR